MPEVCHHTAAEVCPHKAADIYNWIRY